MEVKWSHEVLPDSPKILISYFLTNYPPHWAIHLLYSLSLSLGQLQFCALMEAQDQTQMITPLLQNVKHEPVEEQHSLDVEDQLFLFGKNPMDCPPKVYVSPFLCMNM